MKKTKKLKFLVIEDAGLGTKLCNAKVTVEASSPVEAAIKATGCPTKMVAFKDSSEKGVWEVHDLMSANGWSGPALDDPEQVKLLEEMVQKGFAKKRTFAGLKMASYDPINQWLVTVVQR